MKNWGLYPLVTFEELEALVEDMKAFAKREIPLNYDEIARQATQQPGIKTEQHGALIRVSGDQAVKGVEKYNRFAMVGDHALQLCYYEMMVPEMGRMGQVTVVDNRHMALEDMLKLGFCEMFLDWDRKDEIKIMPTPPHVLVAIQKVKPDDKTIH